MSDPADDLVDETTRSVEEEEAHQRGGADRPPTSKEERLAEQTDPDPEVAEAYKEATERGAEAEGEGRID